ncbi:phosphocarrier protein HPr [Aequitasia blattaphilus]|uniref:HPr family phosphocarrier protein n=1 Tax=Aequitasia blattaphilus TaxID=2949332 RepID=A0ABT1E5T2_9FIRM|nr:HPr family phosphocarrier protein [Aequitasia blattaphilus]MCP1101202.1 HPr family phosphocarrier protein [Aequitasia blattaphilus]MCR8613842.1 HPr family phosphocarrier protein [Aequitasia blattaphilus]
MKSFEYVITDEIGMHARPAGLLVKEAGKYTSKIVVKKGEREAAGTKLLALMSLGIKQNDSITVEVEGEDEEAAVQGMKDFFEGNL